MRWATLDISEKRPAVAIWEDTELVAIFSVGRKTKSAKTIEEVSWVVQMGDPFAVRVKYEGRLIHRLLKLIGNDFDGYVMEEGYVGQNKRTALGLAEERGFADGVMSCWTPTPVELERVAPDRWAEIAWEPFGFKPPRETEARKEMSLRLFQDDMVTLHEDRGLPMPNLSALKDDEADAYHIGRYFILTGGVYRLAQENASHHGSTGFVTIRSR